MRSIEVGQATAADALMKTSVV